MTRIKLVFREITEKRPDTKCKRNQQISICLRACVRAYRWKKTCSRYKQCIKTKKAHLSIPADLIDIFDRAISYYVRVYLPYVYVQYLQPSLTLELHHRWGERERETMQDVPCFCLQNIRDPQLNAHIRMCTYNCSTCHCTLLSSQDGNRFILSYYTSKTNAG